MKPATLPKTKLSDLQLLGGLKAFAWLSPAQLKKIDEAMTSRNVQHKEVIFKERGILSLDTHILLTGTAELSHVNGARPRVVAILSPGVIYRIPLMTRGIDHHFQWTALNDCRVSQLTTDNFIKITLDVVPANFRKVADTLSPGWGGLIGRYPSFLGLSLQRRVAVALLELSVEFGVPNSRGILIRIILTQQQLADLVGASRAKVGQVLLDLERKKIVAREGRRLAVLTRPLLALVKSNGQTAV